MMLYYAGLVTNLRSTILKIAKRRKTTRRFSNKLVDLDLIMLALEAVCEAPSGANSQSWRFILIDDSNVKRKLKEECELSEKRYYNQVRVN